MFTLEADPLQQELPLDPPDLEPSNDLNDYDIDEGDAEVEDEDWDEDLDEDADEDDE